MGEVKMGGETKIVRARKKWKNVLPLPSFFVTLRWFWQNISKIWSRRNKIVLGGQNCSRPTPKSGLVGKISLELVSRRGNWPQINEKCAPKKVFFYVAGPLLWTTANYRYVAKRLSSTFLVDASCHSPYIVAAIYDTEQKKTFVEQIFAGPISPRDTSSSEILPTRHDFGVGREQFWPPRTILSSP